MRSELISSLAVIALCFLGIEAYAQEKAPEVIKPVIVYSIAAHQQDEGFNQQAAKGADLAKKELGLDYAEIYAEPGETPSQLLHKALMMRPPLIVAIGFHYVVPVLELAEKNPETHFTVIDGIVPPLFPNVRSILFKDHEGAFLVGMVAALASQNGKVGFVGGMDVPLIRNFAHGYEQGAKYVKKDIQVAIEMVGSTPEAWNDQAKAEAIAAQEFASGVDVIFTAAGASGLGVLKAAKAHKKLAIGVDTNQNGIYPGSVLTSLVKRVDKAVYEALRQQKEGSWEAGIKYLGLKEGALDYAVDTYNRDLITRDMIDRVETAKDLILRGALQVETYAPN